MKSIAELLLGNLTEMNLLWIRCKGCEQTQTVPYDESKHLPECPICGPTEWNYSLDQIDELKKRNK